MEEYFSGISEVFIEDPVSFQKDIFDLWLREYSVEQAMNELKKKEESTQNNPNNDDKFLLEEVYDSVNFEFVSDP